jgi:hypothetical protein
MQAQIFCKLCVRHDPDLLFEITQIDAAPCAIGFFPRDKPPRSAAQQTGDIHVQSSASSKNRPVGRFAKLSKRLRPAQTAQFSRVPGSPCERLPHANGKRSRTKKAARVHYFIDRRRVRHGRAPPVGPRREFNARRSAWLKALFDAPKCRRPTAATPHFL